MLAVLASFSTFSQSDSNLSALFSEKQQKELRKTSPQVLDFWTYVSENACQIEKSEKQIDLSGLDMIKYESDFNILAHTDLIGNVRKYYKSPSGELIIIKSMDELVKGYNNKEGK